jgi:hypothetical protein
VHLDIQVGEHANNYPEIAAKDKLTELQLRARQLLDQVEQIQKEQDYQRVRALISLYFEVAADLCTHSTYWKLLLGDFPDQLLRDWNGGY